MPNQFQDYYKDTDKTLVIEPQSEFKTFRIVDPDNESLFWGGFKTRWNARNYARNTLGAAHLVFK